ncbi:MAG: hypothetical protein QXF76_01325 [Candidatus Anstonellales archaeon]
MFYIIILIFLLLVCANLFLSLYNDNYSHYYSLIYGSQNYAIARFYEESDKKELAKEINNIITSIVNSEEYNKIKDEQTKIEYFKTKFEEKMILLDLKLNLENKQIVCVESDNQKKILLIEKINSNSCISCKKICDYIFVPETKKVVLFPNNRLAILGKVENFAYLSISEVNAYG